MDVDGESTSPGAVRVPAEEQLVRDLPVACENPDVTGDCRHEVVAGSSRCLPRGSPRIRQAHGPPGAWLPLVTGKAEAALPYRG